MAAILSQCDNITFISNRCRSSSPVVTPTKYEIDWKNELNGVSQRSTIISWSVSELRVNTLRPRQNGRHFADDILKCIFFNENVWILIEISLKFVPKGPIDNIPALVQTMAWRRPGDKPLSEPMVVSLLTHIFVTRPQWVNLVWNGTLYYHHGIYHDAEVYCAYRV